MKRFKLEKRGKNAELYIYDTIGEDIWGGVSSKSLYEDLKAMGAVGTLTIRLNSEGGDLFEGVAMYNHIRNAEAYKRVVMIDALAASAASLVAMAGDEIHIAQNAWMMFHNPMGMTMGDYRDHDQNGMLLRQLTESVSKTYADRSGLKIDEVREIMDAETWLDGPAAVKKGFATQLGERMDVAAKLDLTRWPNAPEPLKLKADPDVITSRLARMSRRVDRYHKRG